MQHINRSIAHHVKCVFTDSLVQLGFSTLRKQICFAFTFYCFWLVEAIALVFPRGHILHMALSSVPCGPLLIFQQKEPFTKMDGDSQNFEFGSQRGKREPRKSSHNNKGVLHQFLLRMCSIMGEAGLDLKQQRILLLVWFFTAIPFTGTSTEFGRLLEPEITGSIQFLFIYIIYILTFIFFACVCGLIFTVIEKIKITTRAVLLLLRVIGALAIKILTPLIILCGIIEYAISHIESTEGVLWFLTEVVNTKMVYIVVIFLLGYWGVKILYLDEATDED